MIEEIISIARYAGNLLLCYKNENPEFSINDLKENNFKNKADIISNNYITQTLKKLFPKDEIISEESKKKVKNYSARVWFVDPLDGTAYFENHMKSYSISIGLLEKGFLKLGVVYAPEQHKIYYAEKNKGAYIIKNDKRIKIEVSTIDEITEARLLVSGLTTQKKSFDLLLEEIDFKERIIEGGAALKFCKIAEGEAEVYIRPGFGLKKWDTCAAQIILEEAGGKVSDIYGKALNYTQKSLRWQQSVIASNNKLYTKVGEALWKKIKELGFDFSQDYKYFKKPRYQPVF